METIIIAAPAITRYFEKFWRIKVSLFSISFGDSMVHKIGISADMISGGRMSVARPTNEPIIIAELKLGFLWNNMVKYKIKQ